MRDPRKIRDAIEYGLLLFCATTTTTGIGFYLYLRNQVVPSSFEGEDGKKVGGGRRLLGSVDLRAPAMTADDFSKGLIKLSRGNNGVGGADGSRGDGGSRGQK